MGENWKLPWTYDREKNKRNLSKSLSKKFNLCESPFCGDKLTLFIPHVYDFFVQAELFKNSRERNQSGTRMHTPGSRFGKCSLIPDASKFTNTCFMNWVEHYSNQCTALCISFSILCAEWNAEFKLKSNLREAQSLIFLPFAVLTLKQFYKLHPASTEIQW